MLRIIEITLFVFFSLPIIGLLLGYRPWDGQRTFEEWEATTGEDASRDEQEVAHANVALVRELGNAEGRPRSSAVWSSEDAPESYEAPIPTPLSPWLDESR